VDAFLGAGQLPKDFELDYPMAKATESDTFCFTDSQFEAMIRQSTKLPEPRWLYPVLLTLGLTGVRISELIGLRWADIDFAKKRIRVKDERYGRKGTTGAARTTKGRKSRRVPIFRPLLQVLQQLPKHKDGFVFHGAKGARVDQDRVLRAFKRDILMPLREKFPTLEGEIGFEHGVIHGLRHHFVSRMARERVPMHRIKKWGGHGSSKMVEYYCHTFDDEEEADIERIRFLPDVSSPGLPLGQSDEPNDSTEVA
jgi:integrase